LISILVHTKKAIQQTCYNVKSLAKELKYKQKENK